MTGDDDLRRSGGLWTMIACPTIWAAHFLLCYVGAAIFCAKAGRGADLWPVQLWVVGVTLLAVIAVALLGLQAWRRWASGEEVKPPYDVATVDDRRRFMGYATFLLAGLSFVAILYGALPALLIGTCR